jgi:hypothetical protein
MKVLWRPDNGLLSVRKNAQRTEIHMVWDMRNGIYDADKCAEML